MAKLPFWPRMMNSILKRVGSGYCIASTKKISDAKFQKRFHAVSEQLGDSRFDCNWDDRWPCLDDATSATLFDAHYLYHTAWAARILAETKPAKHVDVGSCLRFVSMGAAICPFDFYDYRPAKISFPGLSCKQGDLLSLDIPDNSIASLSCMHVVEHVGLERYGDSFDPQGDLKAISELQRVAQPGCNVLFVVPLGGRAKIQYNAHRIYTYQQIISYFDQCDLNAFSLITDGGDFIVKADKMLAQRQSYGCGCFWFKKK